MIELLIAFGGGLLSAAGIFALITTIGILNRFMKVTHTANCVVLYEEMIIFGATIGNILSVFEVKFNLIGCIATLCIMFWGLISGVYVGCFAVCLAESIKTIPIFVKRSKITSGIGFIILAIALGKGVGGLVCYLYLY